MIYLLSLILSLLLASVALASKHTAKAIFQFNRKTLAFLNPATMFVGAITLSHASRKILQKLNFEITKPDKTCGIPVSNVPLVT